MTHSLLFPHKYKRVGWFILIPSFILGLIHIFTHREEASLQTKVLSIFPDMNSEKYFQLIEVNLYYTILGIFFIVGAMLVGFSKEVKEDEYIAQERLSSLLWAVFVNYALLLIAFIFVYNFKFLDIMVYNMFTVLIFFIFRFNFILFKHRKDLSNAE
jgi:hypothetical protein